MPRKTISIGSPQYEYDFSNDFGPFENGVGYAIAQWMGKDAKLAEIDRQKVEDARVAAKDGRDAELQAAHIGEIHDAQRHRGVEEQRQASNDSWGRLRDVGSGIANAMRITSAGHRNDHMPQPGQVAPSALVQELTTGLTGRPIIDGFGNPVIGPDGKPAMRYERAPNPQAEQRLRDAGIDPKTLRFIDPNAVPPPAAVPAPAPRAPVAPPADEPAPPVSAAPVPARIGEAPGIGDRISNWFSMSNGGPSGDSPDMAGNRGVPPPRAAPPGDAPLGTVGEVEGAKAAAYVPDHQTAASLASLAAQTPPDVNGDSDLLNILGGRQPNSQEGVSDGGLASDPPFTLERIVDQLVADPVEREEARRTAVALWRGQRGPRSKELLRVLLRTLAQGATATAASE
jgi:hypothetical protein